MYLFIHFYLFVEATIISVIVFIHYTQSIMTKSDTPFNILDFGIKKIDSPNRRRVHDSYWLILVALHRIKLSCTQYYKMDYMDSTLNFIQNNLTVSFLLIGLLILLVGLWMSRRLNRLPPGPWFFFPGKKAHIDLTELSEKYGSIYSLRFGPVLVAVVVNDLETFRDVFIKEGDLFIDRNIPPLIREIAPIEGRWKRRSRSDTVWFLIDNRYTKL